MNLVVTTYGICDCGCNDSALKVEVVKAMVDGFIFTTGDRVFSADTLREVRYIGTDELEAGIGEFGDSAGAEGFGTTATQGTASSEHYAILPETDPRARYMLLLEEYNALKVAKKATPTNNYVNGRFEEVSSLLDDLECELYGSYVESL